MRGMQALFSFGRKPSAGPHVGNRGRAGESPPAGGILHVAAHLGEASSGLSRAVWDLAVAQRGAGRRVAIGTTTTWVDDPVSDQVVGGRPDVLVFPVAGPPSVRLSPGAERWATSRDAASFSIIHQHGIWPAFSRVTLRWRERHGGPVVLSPHGMLEPAALSYSRCKKAIAGMAYERRNLAQASCLHATAEAELQSIRDFGLRNPVAVIPIGVPDAWVASEGDGPRFRASYGVPPGPPLLLYLSRIHRKKGLLDLVQAIGRAGRRLEGWSLVVAGPVDDGAYFAAVQEAIAEHGLSSRVNVVGELRGQERRDVFAAAELMVLPTLSENFGLVVAEALGAGVPVITTRGAMAWKALGEERCGWWIPPGVQSLEEALVAATRLDDAERAEMGECGRALVRREYQMAPVAAKTLALYAWLLGDAERPDFVVTD